MTTQAPVFKTQHTARMDARRYGTLIDAIDDACDLPNGHIHDEGTDDQPCYYVEDHGPDEDVHPADRAHHAAVLIVRALQGCTHLTLLQPSGWPLGVAGARRREIDKGGSDDENNRD